MTQPFSRYDVAASDSQGKFRKVLCVCNSGINRAPTLAWMLSQPQFDLNCRAVGSESSALIRVDAVHVFWADEIICMEDHNAAYIRDWFMVSKPIKILGIEDKYLYREPELIQLLKSKINR
jgi:predicted protein tyrosine phosphatase